MNELANKILKMLDEVDEKTALEVLSEVVKGYELNVAANLIKHNLEPVFATKSNFEEHFYSEGNDSAGHLPLNVILKSFEGIVNADDEEENIVRFEKQVVRRYTAEELIEEGKDKDGIDWYKRDEEKTTDGILIGFESFKL